MSSCSYHGWHQGWHPEWPPWAVGPARVYWPVWIYPMPPHPPAPMPSASPPDDEASIPRQIEVDETTPAAEATIGGDVPARLRIEYRGLPVEGDEILPGMIALELEHDAEGLRAEWKRIVTGTASESTALFERVSPGAKVRLSAESATARLLWKEIVR